MKMITIQISAWWLIFFVVFQVAIVPVTLWSGKIYFGKRLENLATIQDIRAITQGEQEVVRSFQIDASRIALRNDAMSRITELMYKAEIIADEWMEKNPEKALRGEVPYKDDKQMLEVMDAINVEFAKLYMFLPDELYSDIESSIQTGKYSLLDHRNWALVTFRKASFPESKFLDPKFIRTLKHRRSPDRSAEGIKKLAEQLLAKKKE